MADRLAEQEAVRREFVVNASHELRTPLTNLQGYLEALRDGVLPPDPATFDSLREEVDRLTRLAASLDVLAGAERRRGPCREDVDLGALVAASAELVAPALARRSISLDSSIAPAGFVVHARSDELTQVRRQPAPERRSATRPPAARCEVAVAARRRRRPGPRREHGPGIPADDLPRVWERFYRVEKSRDRARGGAGIGLAIVQPAGRGRRRPRRRHLSEGGWTTFWLTLPA